MKSENVDIKDLRIAEKDETRDADSSDEEISTDTSSIDSDGPDELPGFDMVVPHGIRIAYLFDELNGIGLATVTLLKLAVICDRCRSQNQISVATKAKAMTLCSRCNACLTAEVDFLPMHSTNNVAGFAEVEGCDPFGCDGTDLHVLCSDCGTEHLLAQIHNGETSSFVCTSCHRHSCIKFRDASFPQ